MKSTIVVGLQWGDEGKGKIIDVVAPGFDAVVRWNGGNNAGHTIVLNGTVFPLSLIPSGVFHRKKLYIAQGVVINPKILLNEIRMLEKAGFTVRLMIDPRCHIVMPYHSAMDAATEAWKGAKATGSLHLGIGYCYEDRNNRMGIRLEDLIRPAQLQEKLEYIVPLKKLMIEKAYGVSTELTVDDIYKEYVVFGKALRKYTGDVSREISQTLKSKKYLFEQAHGTMLDPVFGTYPYTVAPPTIASAMFPAVGIAAETLPVLGIVKAYTTRVGNGPFPTEQLNGFGVHMQTEGKERGTVSGRVRRCGWLDLPMLRYAVRLNGCTGLALTKLDVLSGIGKLRICTGYRLGSKILDEFPSQMSLLPRCRPIYKEVTPWSQDISNVRQKKDLPRAALAYIDTIEKDLHCPVQYISIGRERSATIHL